MLALPLAITWLAALALAPLDGRRPWVGWLAVASLAGGWVALVALAVVVFVQGPIELVAGGWPPGVGIVLRADPLGVVYAVLSLGVLLVALVYEVLGGVHSRTLPALVLFLATGLAGLFLTGDAFNFYVFFEVSMASAFILASYGGQRRQIRDALTFTVVNLLGSALFLAAVIALYHVSGTLTMRDLAARLEAIDSSSLTLIAVLVFAAFGLKLGLFPFHFWLPPVYQGSLPAVAAILSGALANIGSYGLLRFGAGLLPFQLQLGGTALLVLGTTSILYGGVLAVGRRSATEVLAYSSISQAGYIIVGLAVGGPIGYAAAVLYAVVNALNKTVLFLASGSRGPLVGAAFAVGALSVAGVPPAVGFFGKAAIFQSGVAAQSVALLALVFLGSALSFVYLFQVYQRDYWAQPAADQPSRPAVRALLVGLAALVLALGAWPEPLLAVSQQAAATLVGGR